MGISGSSALGKRGRKLILTIDDFCQVLRDMGFHVFVDKANASTTLSTKHYLIIINSIGDKINGAVNIRSPGDISVCLFSASYQDGSVQMRSGDSTLKFLRETFVTSSMRIVAGQR